jgi:hypothetical protein
MLWESRLILRSVPIRRLDANLQPEFASSGCLVDFRGRRILLTAEHAVRKGGNWAIEVGYMPGRGTEFSKIGPLNFVAQLRIGLSRARTIDLAYAEVPRHVKPLFQDFDTKTGKLRFERPRVILRSKLDQRPRREGKYGFAGYVRLKRNKAVLEGFLKVETGLRFERSLKTMDRYRLPHGHPGHMDYFGCSGAPLLDRAGHLVGLVVGGHMRSNAIYAVPLAKYRSAIGLGLGLPPS